MSKAADREPTRPMLARRTDPASAVWEEVTAIELRDEVVDVVKGLIASGIVPGHRVAIMARTRTFSLSGRTLPQPGRNTSPALPSHCWTTASPCP
ncbi:hypothetical protein [Streptomyces sp. NPDC006355]|uniref:hypothetical protein n=1 Tax=Streptomyces sp. NPDC006355 TaxID=3156758 RepID=UPI00339FF1FB